MSDPDAYYPADEDRPGYELPDPRPGEDDHCDEEARCECCQSLPGCMCDIYEYYRDDPETGPEGGSVCHTHGRCV